MEARITNFLSVAAIAIAISSCGVAAVNDIRHENKGRIEFMVDQNYQAVYRTIVESQYVPARETKSELYTDINAGKIWFQSTVTPFGSFVLVDVIKIDEKHTSVKYYYLYSAWESTGKNIKSLFPSAKDQ